MQALTERIEGCNVQLWMINIASVFANQCSSGLLSTNKALFCALSSSLPLFYTYPPSFKKILRVSALEVCVVGIAHYVSCFIIAGYRSANSGESASFSCVVSNEEIGVYLIRESGDCRVVQSRREMCQSRRPEWWAGTLAPG
jgi:hypothetical protein